MPTSNAQIINKADFVVQDLVDAGGYLVPEQAKKFMRILILRSVLMKMVTFTPMRNPTKLIDQMNFASRVLRAGQEGVALGESERSKPDTYKVQLESKLFKGEVRLSSESLEDNIERESWRNSVMQELSKAISRDMEDAVINSDTTSLIPFYAQFDGVRAAATSNIVDVAGGTLTKDVLRDLQKILPREYLMRESMSYLTSVSAEIDYRDSTADRATPLGDRAYGATARGDKVIGYTGIPVNAIPLFPQELGGGGDQTDVIFCDPKNIHVGVQRNIRMETDKDVSAGQLIVVVTLRMDVKYAWEPAAAKAINVSQAS
jgi:HK97 family phage major capsid protein